MLTNAEDKCTKADILEVLDFGLLRCISMNPPLHDSVVGGCSRRKEDGLISRSWGQVGAIRGPSDPKRSPCSKDVAPKRPTQPILPVAFHFFGAGSSN